MLVEGQPFKFSELLLPGNPKNAHLSESEKVALQSSELIEIENLTQDSVVVDLGANVGDVIEALKGSGCQIYAFEPHPMLYKNLLDKYKDCQNIVLSDKAAWLENGAVRLYFKGGSEDNNGGATLFGPAKFKTPAPYTHLLIPQEEMPDSLRTVTHSQNQWKSTRGDTAWNEWWDLFSKDHQEVYNDAVAYLVDRHSTNVDCFDVSEFILGLDKEIDVLKIDVEGPEYFILDKIYDTGAYKKIKSFYVEDHERAFCHNPDYSREKKKVTDKYASKGISLNWW